MIRLFGYYIILGIGTSDHGETLASSRTGQTNENIAIVRIFVADRFIETSSLSFAYQQKKIHHGDVANRFVAQIRRGYVERLAVLAYELIQSLISEKFVNRFGGK